MRVFAVIGVITPLLLAPLSAAAQDAEGPSHRGLFLRLTVGIGGGDAVRDGNPEVELKGPAGYFSFDLGGTLAERLALHVRLSGLSMVSPSVSIESDDGNALGDTSETSVNFSLLGPGLTYYFPSNWYLTGVVGISSATFEVAGEESETDAGFGLSADLGHEWWVGGDWGLGVAGRFEFHSVPDGADRLTAGALGVLFTATYH